MAVSSFSRFPWRPGLMEQALRPRLDKYGHVALRFQTCKTFREHCPPSFARWRCQLRVPRFSKNYQAICFRSWTDDAFMVHRLWSCLCIPFIGFETIKFHGFYSESYLLSSCVMVKRL